MKKIISLALILVLAMTLLAGCAGSSTTDTSSIESNVSQEELTESTNSSEKTLNKRNEAEVDQLAMPDKGDTVATMTTNMGVIKIRFFDEIAPKAVENFVKHSKDGYYDGRTFHRVMDEFMIQGGDPTGTGMGGESIWGAAFEDEFAVNLNNIRGALCMANSGPNTNGSQFFIVQNKTIDWSVMDMSAELYLENMGYDVTAVPQSIRDKYTENGGACWLDGAFRTTGGHTVFGQVFEGMDVVDAIAAVEVDGSSKPLKDVIIESIVISEYEA